MSDILRRWYNAVDRFFDRQALTQELHFSQELREPFEPQTARYAFEIARQAAQKLDRKACLKLMVAPDGVDAGGRSARWEFFFDLPWRRARLECSWILSWDVEGDSYGPARLEVIARPFPPANGLLRQMVKEGKLLHRQLVGHWREERRRSPDLPFHFRDSNEVIVELIEQGLDLSQDEFSLSSGLSPAGKLSWRAQTREKEFYGDLVGKA